jgi:hypothetical protein
MNRKDPRLKLKQRKIRARIILSILIVFFISICATGASESMKPLNKRQIRVVIGNGEENINELISELIKDVINNKYGLTIKSVFYGEELMEIAENNDADIFIVIVNNIRFRPFYPPQERIEKSLHLITQIKKMLGKPVIALYPPLIKLDTGVTIPLEEKVKQTRADFYFPLPSNPDDFKMAFEKCIGLVRPSTNH